jgi:hypothetical protein
VLEVDVEVLGVDVVDELLHPAATTMAAATAAVPVSLATPR